MLYKYGVVVGRFQGFHRGHFEIINTALNLCDKVVVFVGSPNAKPSEKNPFDYQYRSYCIKNCFPQTQLEILPLNDIGVGDVPAWGDYLVSEYKHYTGSIPDLYVSGIEGVRTSWFINYDCINLHQVARGKIPYSGTMLRNAILSNNYELFCKIVPNQLIKEYKNMYTTITTINKQLNRLEN